MPDKAFTRIKMVSSGKKKETTNMIRMRACTARGIFAHSISLCYDPSLLLTHDIVGKLPLHTGANNMALCLTTEGRCAGG